MRVRKVEYFAEYKLKILFSDNKTKVVDIEPILNKSKGLFHPLKDLEYFKSVSLDDSEYPVSICWPNGADICPDYLYEIGIDIEDKEKALRPTYESVEKNLEGSEMPEEGVAIYIRYSEHNPPHFHAEYGKFNAAFLIQDLKMLEGKMPPRVKALILEWADMHRDELMIDWDLAQQGKSPLNKIKGLV